MQVAPAAIGSLSYAEDDNRHFLGVKAAVVNKAGRSQYCCYVLECDNEVCVCVCVCVSFLYW